MTEGRIERPLWSQGKERKMEKKRERESEGEGLLWSKVERGKYRQRWRRMESRL